MGAYKNGGHNIKLIEYPNGTQQLRRYDKPIANVCSDSYEAPEVPEVYEVNPFDGKLTRVVDEFRSATRSAVSSEEDNQYRSFSRTTQKIHEIARCGNWEYFITLTLAPDKIDRTDFEQCSKACRKWLNNQRRYAPDLQYLIIPEFHKDGAIHFHGLLANIGDMVLTDSGHKTKNQQTIYNLDKWKLGFSTATRIESVEKASKYVCKYMTKDLCVATKGKQRYFVSNNLPKPKVSTFMLGNDEDFEEFLQMYCDSVGLEVLHVSKPRHEGAYTNTDYYELGKGEEHDTTRSI